jgi:hypothetical protein
MLTSKTIGLTMFQLLYPGIKMVDFVNGPLVNKFVRNEFWRCQLTKLSPLKGSEKPKRIFKTNLFREYRVKYISYY